MVELIFEGYQYQMKKATNEIAKDPSKASEYELTFTEGIGPKPEIVVSTGRATCRFCGKKIAKGARALKFFHDFNGCGSWTAVEIQVHLDGCPA